MCSTAQWVVRGCSDGPGFRCLLVQGNSPRDIGHATELIGTQLANAKIAFNILVVPDENHQVILIPRAKEYSDVGYQNIAGLELMTLFLQPNDQTVAKTFTSSQRDQAIAVVTMDQSQFDSLIEGLRDRFGLYFAQLRTVCAPQKNPV